MPPCPGSRARGWPAGPRRSGARAGCRRRLNDAIERAGVVADTGGGGQPGPGDAGRKRRHRPLDGTLQAGQRGDQVTTTALPGAAQRADGRLVLRVVEHDHDPPAGGHGPPQSLSRHRVGRYGTAGSSPTISPPSRPAVGCGRPSASRIRRNSSPTAVPPGEPAGDEQRRRRLADARRTVQGDEREPVRPSGGGGDNAGHLLVAAHDVRRYGRQLVRGARCGRAAAVGQVVGEDPAVQRAQVRRRLDPELGAEAGPQPTIVIGRLDAAALPPQPRHQQPVDALQRVLGEQPTCFGHHVRRAAGELQLQLQPDLRRGQPLVVEAVRGSGKAGGAQVGQGRAAPASLGRAQQVQPGRTGTRLGPRDEAAEDVHVERVWRQVETVAGAVGPDDVGGRGRAGHRERLAQAADDVVHLGDPGRRPALAPDQVTDLLGADHRGLRDGERGQHEPGAQGEAYRCSGPCPDG